MAKLGKHPDLFGGDTDIVVDISIMSDSELESLLRSNLTVDEAEWLYRNKPQIFEIITDNSESLSAKAERAVLDAVIAKSQIIVQEEFDLIVNGKIDRQTAEDTADNYAYKANKSSDWAEKLANKLESPSFWTFSILPDVSGSTNRRSANRPDLERNFDDWYSITVDTKDFGLIHDELVDFVDDIYGIKITDYSDALIEEATLNKDNTISVKFTMPYKIVGFANINKALADTESPEEIARYFASSVN